MTKGMRSSGKPKTNMTPSSPTAPAAGRQPTALGVHSPGGAPEPLRLGLLVQHLPAAIHAGLEIDVVRAAQLAGILVLDIGRPLQCVGGATHAALGGRRFSLRHGHAALSFALI